MVSLTAFTRCKFDTLAKAREFLEFLSEDGSLLKPAKYGVSEQARQAFNRERLDEPAQVLSGEPGDRGGSIFLKGAKHKTLASIQWGDSGISDWYAEIDDTFFLKEDGTAQFVQFLERLFLRFPAEFCGAAPAEDWKTKHWIVERTALGESHEKKGLEIGHCLPGVYWITLMGQTLVKKFGKDNLEQLPVHQVVDLGDQGLLLVLREKPYSANSAQRQEQDTKIRSLVGDRFFFDIRNPEKRCEEIAGVTSTQLSSETREGDHGEKKGNGELSKFEEQTILSPDGTPYDDPEYLAEVVVVYFHSDLNEVFGYSLDALRALDAYFALHPPQREFKHEFLFKELIPALGAYLGKVFTRGLGGKWLIRNPIMKSTVKNKRNERNPFHDAYEVVMNGKHLVDAYEVFQST